MQGHKSFLTFFPLSEWLCPSLGTEIFEVKQKRRGIYCRFNLVPRVCVIFRIDEHRMLSYSAFQLFLTDTTENCCIVRLAFCSFNFHGPTSYGHICIHTCILRLLMKKKPSALWKVMSLIVALKTNSQHDRWNAKISFACSLNQLSRCQFDVWR